MAETAGDKVILAGDVGGTKILLEVGDLRSGRWVPALARRYLVADFPSLDKVLEVFLGEWATVRPARARITAGAIGVAGPCIGNCVTLTNHPWRMDGDKLAARHKIPRLRLLNDLAAAAYGLDIVPAKDLMTIQKGRAVEGGNQVVLGVGTGLGVAYRLSRPRPQPRRSSGAQLGSRLRGSDEARGSDELIVIPSEGGHTGFAPATPQQLDMWSALSKKHPRVIVEHVVSGAGLARDGPELFAANLGNVAGDQALNVLATGGVFLCGGVIARCAPSFQKDAFCAAFTAKGQMSSLLMRIPVRAVTNEKLALLGAASVAATSV